MHLHVQHHMYSGREESGKDGTSVCVIVLRRVSMTMVVGCGRCCCCSSMCHSALWLAEGPLSHVAAR